MADDKQNGGKLGVGLSDAELNGAISKMIARHVVQLSEHVSSIQVVCTKLEEDGSTSFFRYGSGDIYARAKAVEVWLSSVQE